MSKSDPTHSFEVQWEGVDGQLRSQQVDGDDYETFFKPNPFLRIWYDGRDPHFQVVGRPFIIREVSE